MTSNSRRLQPLKAEAHLLCIWWHWSASVMTRDHMTRVSRVACGHMTHTIDLISSLWSQLSGRNHYQPSATHRHLTCRYHNRHHQTVDCFYRARNKNVAEKGITRGNIAGGLFYLGCKISPDSIFWFRVRYLEAESPLGSGNLLHCRGQSHPSHENSSSAQPESLKHQAGYLTASIRKRI